MWGKYDRLNARKKALPDCKVVPFILERSICMEAKKVAIRLNQKQCRHLKGQYEVIGLKMEPMIRCK